MAEPHRRTVRDLRRSNRSTVLTKLYFEGPLSRQELGPLTGLSSGSISNVAGELIADGIVEDAGSVESDGGRPRTLLRVAPGSGHLVGVDVGETRIRVELFDLALTELARADLPLPPDGHDVERVVRLIGEGLQQVLLGGAVRPVPVTGLLGIGVGVPGIVDSGSVVHGQTIGWDAVPLGSLLRESGQLPADIPLFIDNGAKTLGRAEMWFGAGRGARNAVVTLIGSGVGACVIADGVPYQGASSSAGEWGHTVLQVVGGRGCRCGSRGCLEAYVGAEAVLQRWRERGGSWTAADEEGALAELLADPAAGPLLDETAEYLGAGIADLVNLFNPERIVVGGWAGLLLGPRLLDRVRDAAASYALRHPFAGTSLVLGRLGPDAVTVGAATLPLARFLEAGGAVRSGTEAGGRGAEPGSSVPERRGGAAQGLPSARGDRLRPSGAGTPG
ncbi:ROK family transcriptional regulator [Streptomyces indicus]|uniref:Sugar kinase of the NBD/HSP70 family, may contain an N-terminal HTH domain n=1 Tax=Streptomyces indicus TaxID=417292 RepID=A0A1G8UXD8_9ACTN|nr:ROK family transcriptional regulator [Streptomyces indicus]SDJ58481.1 Sugar kinase of the NBD/HSP70 family, may contain an N-terminal HTH domain [Streptomyces indicus]